MKQGRQVEQGGGVYCWRSHRGSGKICRGNGKTGPAHGQRWVTMLKAEGNVQRVSGAEVCGKLYVQTGAWRVGSIFDEMWGAD